jgi:uncharacterized membrane protein
MRDRGNQAALGTFVGTFTYCLLVLRTVNGTESDRFIPHFAVVLGLLFALASLGMLIYFIHHIADSIQADSVIATVAAELRDVIPRRFPKRGDRKEHAGTLPDGFDSDSCPVPARHGGYIQAVDVGRLVEIARRRDLVARVTLRPGHFAIPGDGVARIGPSGRVDDDVIRAVQRCFIVGRQRTLDQDVEFAFDQLVEVAVRALSPGVNDPFTAISCVDRLGEGLSALAGREVPSPFHHDAGGRLRVVTDHSTIPGIFDAAFHQVRQSARGNVAVTIRMMEVLALLAGRTRDSEFLGAVTRHAVLVRRTAEALSDPDDRADVEERYRHVLRRAAEREGRG